MQEDSNTLKNVLFGYYVQKLYDVKVLLVDILKLRCEQCLYSLDHLNQYVLVVQDFEQIWVSKAVAIIGPT